VSLPIDRNGFVIAEGPHPQTLTALIASNSLSRDSNGDGSPMSCRRASSCRRIRRSPIWKGPRNVAARLGYETTALTLPVVVRDSDVGQPAPIAVPILVGRENRFVKRLADAIRRATGSGRTVSACMYQPGDLEGHRDLL
jgi:hypothetical protein